MASSAPASPATRRNAPASSATTISPTTPAAPSSSAPATAAPSPTPASSKPTATPRLPSRCGSANTTPKARSNVTDDELAEIRQALAETRAAMDAWYQGHPNPQWRREHPFDYDSMVANTYTYIA